MDLRNYHKNAKEERQKNQPAPITKTKHSQKMVEKLIGAVKLNKRKKSEVVNLLLKNGSSNEKLNNIKKSKLVNLLLDNDLYMFFFFIF